MMAQFFTKVVIALVLIGFTIVYSDPTLTIFGAPEVTFIGDTITLICVFDGNEAYPGTNITWFHEDELIEFSQEDNSTTSVSTYTFTVKADKHFTTYECLAVHDNLTSTRNFLSTNWTCVINITPDMPVINGPTFMKSDMPYTWWCSSIGGYPKPNVTVGIEKIPRGEVNFTEVSELSSKKLYKVDVKFTWRPTLQNNGSKIWCVVYHPETTPNNPQHAEHHGVTVQESFHSKALNPPTFISDWHNAAAYDPTQSQITIAHDLGQYPVKVDVQVKVYDNLTDEEYIFTGVGSAQRDDDLDYDYGGVVYKYNTKHIKLVFPSRNNGFERGALVYTGSPHLYTGPNVTGFYRHGMVRVRAWIQSDMPELVYKASMYMDPSTWSDFAELEHQLGFYPDIVTVQTLLEHTTYMSDAQGAPSNLRSTYWNSLGGVTFGYDNKKIRVWSVSFDRGEEQLYEQTGVMVAYDGWSFNEIKKSGIVHVSAWKIDCSNQVFHRKMEIGQYILSKDTLTFPCAINTSDTYVSVQIQAHDNVAEHADMMFYGVGTTMATGVHGYGGVIYAYNDNHVYLWRPVDNANDGSIINIADRWGSNRYSQKYSVADVIIRVFSYKSYETCQCPVPNNVTNVTILSSDYMIGGQTLYICNDQYAHVEGDLIRYCLRNLTWSGIEPICSMFEDDAYRCPVAKNLSNSTLTFFDNRAGGKMIYACKIGFLHVGGDLMRFCSVNLTWTGSDPICSANSDFNVNKLRTNRKSTNRYKRSLISIWDGRLSAVCIGGIGIGVMVLPLLLCLLPDICSMFKHATNLNSLYQEKTIQTSNSSGIIKKETEHKINENNGIGSVSENESDIQN